jgi:hypothetical protein
MLDTLPERVPRSSRKTEIGLSIPGRSFSKRAWWNFSRDRRRKYLAQLAGKLTDRQSQRIETMVRLEWSALRAEAEGSVKADREAREHRRLLDRLLADHERSLVPPKVRPPSPAEHLAARTAGRTAADILAGR